MKEKIRKYLELTKPKVTLLNLFVGITCFFLAAFPSINLIDVAVFCVAGYLACGGCGVLNCVYDQSIDTKMERTSKRAIPAGIVKPGKALLFGSFLTVAGITLSFFIFNSLTALMMALGAAFYLLVYTVVLKQTSSWNVVIGGMAGCFAALSGWTAVTNSVSLLPFLVSAVDFLWTPGHLWGLAMKKVSDYKKAGIPMLPVTAGLKKTAKITFLFNFSAISASLLLPIFSLAGIIYTSIALSMGMWFVWESKKLLEYPSGTMGFKLFLYSMPYLAILMIGLLVDKTFPYIL